MIHPNNRRSTASRDAPRFGLAPAGVSGAGELEACVRRCRDIAKEHSKTFYFASLFLTSPQRRAIWAAYAFCRIADDIADSPAPAPERLRALDDWELRLIAAYDGRPSHFVMVAYAAAAEKFAIPIEPALDLLRGARRDITMHRYERYADLLEHCYLVASTVGLLTCPILGAREEAEPYGIALGRAMQMTNILRDVGEDARAGRIYLPAEDLRRFGCSEAAVLAGTVDSSFVELMKFEIARVRAMYDEAAPGIALLAPGSRLTVRIAFHLYRRILDEIELNGYDVFTCRAHVPLHSKIVTALMLAVAHSSPEQPAAQN